MRIKAEIWVKAYIRLCWGEDVPAHIVRRGHGDAGAIFIKVNTLDGYVAVYGPAPAGLETANEDRMWSPCCGGGPVGEGDADSYLARQADFDSDIWIIEIEDRQGRHFLGPALIADAD